MKKVCKTKDDFLFELHSELHRLGADSDSDIYSDFEEHFKASMLEGLTEEEICEKLGDVSEIARDYVDETEINAMVDKALDKAGSKSVLMSSLPLNPSQRNGTDSQRRGISLKKPRDRRDEELTAESEGAHASVWKNSEELLNSQSQRRGISLKKPEPPTEPPMEDDILPDGTRISAANNYAMPAGPQPAPAQPSQQAQASQQTPPSQQTASGKRNIPTPDTANVNIPPFTRTSQPANTGSAVDAGADTPVYTNTNANTNGTSGGDGSGTSYSYRYNNSTTYNSGPILPEEKPQSNYSHSSSSGFNIGGLIGALCVDIFVLSWAIPALLSVITAYFSVPIGILGGSIGNLVGFASGGAFGLHPISNLLLGLALLCLSVLATLLAIVIVRAFVKLIIKIVKWHIRLIKGESK